MNREHQLLDLGFEKNDDQQGYGIYLWSKQMNHGLWIEFREMNMPEEDWEPIIKTYGHMIDNDRKNLKLERFSKEMNNELFHNRHQGDWEKFIAPKDILNEIDHHWLKLARAMKLDNKKQIKEHIADCANLLLMLGNSYNLYNE